MVRFTHFNQLSLGWSVFSTYCSPTNIPDFSRLNNKRVTRRAKGWNTATSEASIPLDINT
jgi:hypothetical protein